MVLHGRKKNLFSMGWTNTLRDKCNILWSKIAIGNNLY